MFDVIDRALFGWLQPLLSASAASSVDAQVVSSLLPAALEPTVCGEAFQTRWQRVQPQPGSAAKLLAVLASTIAKPYTLLFFLKLLCDSLNFVGPFVLGELITCMSQAAPSCTARAPTPVRAPLPSQGPRAASHLVAAHRAVEDLGASLQGSCAVQAALLSGVAVAKALMGTQYTLGLVKLMTRIQTMLLCAPFHSIFTHRQFDVSAQGTERAVAIVSMDVEKVANVFRGAHELVTLPLQVLAALLMLFLEVRLAFLAGLVLALAMLPVNRWLAQSIAAATERMLECRDRRLSVVGTLLDNLRALHMIDWLHVVQKQMKTHRTDELRYLAYRKYLDALCVCSWALTVPFFVLSTFSVMVLQDGLGALTPRSVLVSMALFNTLIAPLNALPWVLSGTAEGIISARRIASFLMPKHARAAQELACWRERRTRQAEEQWAHEQPASGNRRKLQSVRHRIVLNELGVEPVAVQMMRASFAWKVPPSETEVASGDVLHRLQFSWPKGSFCVVSGPSGSGKSSLLHAVLAELALTEGNVQVRGSCALAPQKPWLIAGTVRDNIVMHRGMDDGWYLMVLEVCELVEDLVSMPDGDATVVSANGDNLSGGQQARVSLARALYSQAEIVLLDSIFASLDARVGRAVLHNMRNTPSIRDSTVICASSEPWVRSEAEFSLTLSKGGQQRELSACCASDGDTAAAGSAAAPGRLLEPHQHVDGDVVDADRPPGVAAAAAPACSAPSVRLGSEFDHGPQPRGAHPLPRVSIGAYVAAPVVAPAGAAGGDGCGGAAVQEAGQQPHLPMFGGDADEGVSVWPPGAWGGGGSTHQELSSLDAAAAPWQASMSTNERSWPRNLSAGSGTDHVRRTDSRRGALTDAADVALDVCEDLGPGQTQPRVVPLDWRAGGSTAAAGSGQEGWPREAYGATGSDEDDDGGGAACNDVYVAVGELAFPAAAGPGGSPDPFFSQPQEQAFEASTLNVLDERLDCAELASCSLQSASRSRPSPLQTTSSVLGGACPPEPSRVLAAQSAPPCAAQPPSQPGSCVVAADDARPVADAPVVSRQASSLVQMLLNKGSGVQSSGESVDTDLPVSSYNGDGGLNALHGPLQPRSVLARDGAGAEAEETDGADAGETGAGEEQEQRQDDSWAHWMRPVDQEEGRISWKVCRELGRAAGWSWLAVVLTSLVLMQACRTATDVYVVMSTPAQPLHDASAGCNASATRLAPGALSPIPLHASSERAGWVSSALMHVAFTAAQAATARGFLVGLGLLGILVLFATAVRAFSFAHTGLRAARRLHEDLLAAVVNAPFLLVSRIDRGRVLARFSSDTAAVDDSLPFTANLVLANFAGFVAAALVMIAPQPGLGVLLCTVVWVLWRLQRVYRPAARELRRLEHATVAPIYSAYEEAVEGAPVARALKIDLIMERRLHESVRKHTAAHFVSQALGQWLAVRLQLLAATLVSVLAWLPVVVAAWLGNGGFGSRPELILLIGLALTYALPAVSLLNGLFTTFTELEQETVSVERLCHLSGLPPASQSREGHGRPGDQVPDPWEHGPEAWSLSFQSISLTYPGRPVRALDGVNVRIPAGQHLGVCGRTGAGKSSLLNVLMGLVQPTHGFVLLGCINLLRERRYIHNFVSVVPQCPVLVHGTVADNLDPHGRYQQHPNLLLQMLRDVNLLPHLLAACARKPRRCPAEAQAAEAAAGAPVQSAPRQCGSHTSHGHTSPPYVEPANSSTVRPGAGGPSGPPVYRRSDSAPVLSLSSGTARPGCDAPPWAHRTGVHSGGESLDGDADADLTAPLLPAEGGGNESAASHGPGAGSGEAADLRGTSLTRALFPQPPPGWGMVFPVVGEEQEAVLQLKVAGPEADCWLSDAQKQQLSVARALLRWPRVLCLDEIGAHLGPEARLELENSISAKLDGVTVLRISHCLETLKRCNVVAVMRSGTLCEQGSPLYLLSREDSAFSQLFNDQ